MSKEITAQERQRRASLAFRNWWESLLQRADQHPVSYTLVKHAAANDRPKSA